MTPVIAKYQTSGVNILPKCAVECNLSGQLTGTYAEWAHVCGSDHMHVWVNSFVRADPGGW